MAVEIEEIAVGAVTVVVVQGRLDGLAAPALDDRLAGLTTRGTKLVLDMAGLDYASSAGLRVLLKAAKQTKASKGRFALAAITPTVEKIFEISGFTTIFDIYPDRDQAAAAIA
ncbi:MAG: STAS domain-containing protein [Pseudomonadota bacterium]